MNTNKQTKQKLVNCEMNTHDGHFLSNSRVRVHELSAENGSWINSVWPERKLDWLTHTHTHSDTHKHTQAIWAPDCFKHANKHSYKSMTFRVCVSSEQDNSFSVRWHSAALSLSTNTLWRISHIRLERLEICGQDVNVSICYFVHREKQHAH